MEWKLINMRVPVDVLGRIDEAAHGARLTRTAYMLGRSDPGEAEVPVVAGLRMEIDPELPPGVVELRGRSDTVRAVNVGPPADREVGPSGHARADGEPRLGRRKLFGSTMKVVVDHDERGKAVWETEL